MRARILPHKFLIHRPNTAKANPQLPTVTSRMSPICAQPSFTTRFERVKSANVRTVIGRQIFSASHMVRMNDAFAMRAETAAESDVGGESSAQTDKKKTKKGATHGVLPRVV